MGIIAELIDTVLRDPENSSTIAAVGAKVVDMMKDRPVFAW